MTNLKKKPRQNTSNRKTEIRKPWNGQLAAALLMTDHNSNTQNAHSRLMQQSEQFPFSHRRRLRLLLNSGIFLSLFWWACCAKFLIAEYAPAACGKKRKLRSALKAALSRTCTAQTLVSKRRAWGTYIMALFGHCSRLEYKEPPAFHKLKATRQVDWELMLVQNAFHPEVTGMMPGSEPCETTGRQRSSR